MSLPASKTSNRPVRPASPRCRGGVSSLLRLAPPPAWPNSWIGFAAERLAGPRAGGARR